jgi:phosphatidyl-myo-inositol alpha-mannosyltransferase
MSDSDIGPLRIGLVCPYSLDYHGGVQNHVLGLARYLRDAGYAPHILAPGGLDQQRRQEIRFTSAGATFAVPYNGSVARVNCGPRSAALVHRWLRESQFDLVHLHEPVTPSVSLLALWLAQQPIVATYHTATPRSLSMHLAGSLLRPWIDKIDAGIAVSKTARSVVTSHLGRNAMIVPNGLAHAEFASPPSSAGPLRPSPWRGGGRPRIVFLGRMDEPRKGLDVLLAAVPAIRAAVPDVDVVIAGSGRRVVLPTVRVLGPVSDEAKRALLASTDVFVAPHRERESFGVVVLEALASGADVVASDLPAFVDLLRRDRRGAAGSLGRIVPVGNPSALAGAVVDRILGREPSAQPEAADAVRRYDWSVVGPAITAVYRQVMSRKASRSRTDWGAVARSGAGVGQ